MKSWGTVIKTLLPEEYLDQSVSFLRWSQKHDDQCAFNCGVFLTIRTAEKKMVMYSFVFQGLVNHFILG